MEKKWYDAHLEEFQKTAYVKGMAEYEAMHRRSLQDPEGFWGEKAKEYLTWEKPWDFVLRYDFEVPTIEWFGGGVLNASYNCIDRHLERLKNKVAYYWVGDDPKQSRVITYLELFNLVNRMAALLRSRGVKRGDRVIIYAPMIIDLPVSMLACARIGAIHSVVFGGFSAESLGNRIRDCGAKVVITADGSFRGGKPSP